MKNVNKFEKRIDYHWKQLIIIMVDAEPFQFNFIKKFQFLALFQTQIHQLINSCNISWLPLFTDKPQNSGPGHDCLKFWCPPRVSVSLSRKSSFFIFITKFYAIPVTGTTFYYQKSLENLTFFPVNFLADTFECGECEN